MDKHLLIMNYYANQNGYWARDMYFHNHFTSVSFFPLVEFLDKMRDCDARYNYSHIIDIVTGQFNKKHLYSQNATITNGNNKITHIMICHNNDMLKRARATMDFIVVLKQMHGIKLVQINWDPMLVSGNAQKYIIEQFDISFCSDPEYIKLCPRVCQFFCAGYNKLTSFPSPLNGKYACDVSIICTNLYTDATFENKTVCRKNVLDAIYADKSIVLHVYGFPFLKTLYPDAYRGFIQYDDCRHVFSNSKISLNISMFDGMREHDGHHYFSERLPQIFGCNGIPLCNNDFGAFLEKDVDYIYVQNMDELMPKIKMFLENCGNCYNKMKERIQQKREMFEYEHIVADIANKMLANNV
jgi:hypothetical protein